MLVNIPKRTGLTEWHRSATRLDFAPNGLTVRLWDGAGLIVPELLVFSSEELPQPRDDVAQ